MAEVTHTDKGNGVQMSFYTSHPLLWNKFRLQRPKLHEIGHWKLLNIHYNTKVIKSVCLYYKRKLEASESTA